MRFKILIIIIFSIFFILGSVYANSLNPLDKIKNNSNKEKLKIAIGTLIGLIILLIIFYVLKWILWFFIVLILIIIGIFILKLII